MIARSLFTILVFLIHIFSKYYCLVSDKNINSTFVATHQWKKVENGQAIPRGLLVRIDLRTGEKEAKLPDPDDQNSKKDLIPTAKTSDEMEKTSLAPEELQRLLKNIKPDDVSKGDISSKNFKSYEKIKEELAKLQIQVKSDYEMLVDLIENFRKYNVKMKYADNLSSNWTEEEEVLNTLIDLEYLVHQYNNAQDFVKLNGFSDVVYKSLNSSSSKVRSEALKLLGSATQSNPNVQIAALESGSINLLIKILTFDEDINVRSRSLFALSCLIRRFPAAQKKLIDDGGLTAFGKIFDEEKHDLLKLQMKVITLIHDLLFERKDTKMSILNKESDYQTDSEIDGFREKLRQYEQINLEQKLVEQEWCKRISDWFLKQSFVKELTLNEKSELNVDNINFDIQSVIEEVIDTLYVLSDICKIQFQGDVDLVELLFSLQEVYDDLATQESKTDTDIKQSYSSLSKILKMLTDKLTGKPKKDEL